MARVLRWQAWKRGAERNEGFVRVVSRAFHGKGFTLARVLRWQAWKRGAERNEGFARVVSRGH